MRKYNLTSITGKKFELEISDKIVRIIGNSETIEMDYNEATKLRMLIATEVKKTSLRRTTSTEDKWRIYKVLKEAERPLYWNEIKERAKIGKRTPGSWFNEDFNIDRFRAGSVKMCEELNIPIKPFQVLWWLKERREELTGKWCQLIEELLDEAEAEHSEESSWG